MKALLTAQQINKTDRNDARGIAQMMRVGIVKLGTGTGQAFWMKLCRRVAFRPAQTTF
jgi:hypothetical protein